VEKPDDFLFPGAAQRRENEKQQGLVFAQKYLVFSGQTADPRARELLEHWTAQARKTRIPAGASAQEYAAHNAFREFVEGIWSQIEFANNGLNQPTPRTAK
jgi:hypothetical protein